MQSKLKLLLLALAAIALVTLFYLGNTTENLAPAFNYTSIKGERTSQQALKGKVVLVNFWATSCSGCMAEMPKLAELQQRYANQGYATVAVAMAYDPPQYVAAYVEKTKLPFFVALDSNGEIARRFGDVKLTPTSFLIDKQGRIVQRYLGEPDFTQLQALIEDKLGAQS